MTDQSPELVSASDVNQWTGLKVYISACLDFDDPKNGSLTSTMSYEQKMAWIDSNILSKIPSFVVLPPRPTNINFEKIASVEKAILNKKYRSGIY